MGKGVDLNSISRFFDVDVLDVEYKQVVKDVSLYDEEYVIDIIYRYYRKHGFPHYKVSESEKYEQYNAVKKFNAMSILKGDEITQTMHSLRLLWTYFPHFWEVPCGTAKFTPMDVFNDDELFKVAIKKTVTYVKKHSENRFHENRLRQCLKIYMGTQTVSNFRPTAAKLIYELYGGDGVVWDPSAGWGGRLLGAMSANNIKHYIGTEPSSKTFEGLLRFKEDFSFVDTEVTLLKLGSEVYRPDKESLDLTFTSPPYFDTEKYSDEDTQSYKKFPNEDLWLNGFMRQTIENCRHGLKNGRYMLINIANTSKNKQLETGVIDLAKELGFNHERTLKLGLSGLMRVGYKYEPIFVFKKR